MSVSIGGLGGGLRSGQRIAAFAVAGLIGGGIGAWLEEIPGQPVTEDQLNSYSGLTFMLVVVSIGAAVLVADSLLRGSPPAPELLLRAGVALLALGYASGYIAQSVYTSMMESAYSDCVDIYCSPDMGTVRVARTIGWGIAGVLGGLGIGLGFGSVKRVQNALIGGAAGGLVGGFLFDYIAEYGPQTDDGLLSRAVAVCLIGLLIGLLISLAETARVDMWLEIVSGEARGRQYLVFDAVTQVGRARTAGVALVGDRSIGEVHFSIHRQGAGSTFTCIPPNTMLHNGQVAMGGSLSNGDLLRVGNTDVMVRYKAASSAVPTHGPVNGAPTWAPSADPRSSAGGRPNASPVSNAPGAGYVPPPPSGGSVPPPGRAPQPSPPPSSRPRLPIKPQ